ncbi:hypothetical protein T265_01025 [Opisthorchis viverrini]|uniref:Uncharacterized protein n=1 Tax=Opisthorchis viverrini TaxID=6198 RepID=A0A075A0P4_OPIVI|nr:hypothetical protein T265_01025 [Opisthorchis viverrini]KER32931.1 hypothetical protein T265_01025 [Opisthorchis viverrini]
MHRRWVPVAMPQSTGYISGEHAKLIHACSDTLRRYCESLWYSGLEYKRPTDEEILAKCGILFYKKPVPTNIMFAFSYQMDNLFAMSKKLLTRLLKTLRQPTTGFALPLWAHQVIHTIRSIMDWLDATENRVFQVMSIYEMHTQIPNFISTISENLKALRICGKLLHHLGSIYHRVRPLKRQESMKVRALTDYRLHSSTFRLRENESYTVCSNLNPHAWQITGVNRLVPSLFLEVSTDHGELKMLNKLQERFDEFLTMCHGRSRRQLRYRLSRQLQKEKRSATFPTLEVSKTPPTSPAPSDGLYFARSPESTRRWRTMDDPKVIYRQPAFSYPPGDVASPDTVHNMMSRLRRWLELLPSPSQLMARARDSTLPFMGQQAMDDSLSPDELLEEIRSWWSAASLFVSDPYELDRIVNEALFLKFSFRWTQKSIDRSPSPHAKSVTGTPLFDRVSKTQEVNSITHV